MLVSEFIQERVTKIWRTRVFHGHDIWTYVCLSVPHFVSGPVMLLNLSLKFSSLYSSSRAEVGARGCL